MVEISSGITSSNLSVGKPVLIPSLFQVPVPHPAVFHHIQSWSWGWGIAKGNGTSVRQVLKYVLVPFGKYLEEKECHDLKRSQPYDANKTKGVDYFLTIPFMMATT